MSERLENKQKNKQKFVTEEKQVGAEEVQVVQEGEHADYWVEDPKLSWYQNMTDKLAKKGIKLRRRIYMGEEY